MRTSQASWTGVYESLLEYLTPNRAIPGLRPEHRPVPLEMSHALRAASMESPSATAGEKAQAADFTMTICGEEGPRAREAYAGVEPPRGPFGRLRTSPLYCGNSLCQSAMRPLPLSISGRFEMPEGSWPWPSCTCFRERTNASI